MITLKSKYRQKIKDMIVSILYYKEQLDQAKHLNQACTSKEYVDTIITSSEASIQKKIDELLLTIANIALPKYIDITQ